MTEMTSPEIAAIAGRILRALTPLESGAAVHVGFWNKIATVAEIQSLCASALTQSADKPKQPRKKT